MLKVLLSIPFLLLAIISGVWLYQHPGTVEVNWFNYTIHLSVASFLLFFFLFFLIFLFLIKVVKFFISLPFRLKNRYRFYMFKKSEDALLIALSAERAGDVSLLGEESDQLLKIEGKRKIATYFKARSLEEAGKEGEASDLYYALTKTKFAEFLGYYGLYCLAYSEKLYESALEKLLQAFDYISLTPFLLRKLEKLVPHVKSLEKMRTFLMKLEQQPKRVLLKHEQVLAAFYSQATLLAEKEQESGLAQTFAEKAYAYNEDFADLYAAQLLKIPKNRKAIKVIENAWRSKPSEKLAVLYVKATASETPLDQVRAIQRLYAIQGDSLAAKKLLAQFALKAELWGVAREALEDLAKRNESLPFVYKGLGEIELKEVQNPEKAILWWRKALESL